MGSDALVAGCSLGLGVPPLCGGVASGWYQTTILPFHGSARTGLLFDGYWYTEALTLRDITRLSLAIHGWRLDHGAYPESLEQLVPDWFELLPVDRSTGLPFGYYPEGVQHTKSMRSGNMKLELPPHLALTDPAIRYRPHNR